MYLLHSLQVAIVTRKSKKHTAIDWTCQMDFNCSSLTRCCKHFWSHVPSPLVAGGYSNKKVNETRWYWLNLSKGLYLLQSLQVAIVTRKSKKHAAIDLTCQEDFKCRSFIRLCLYFLSNVPSPLVAGGNSNGKVKVTHCYLLDLSKGHQVQQSD